MLYLITDQLNVGTAVSLSTKGKRKAPDETPPTPGHARAARDESEQALIPGIVRAIYPHSDQAAEIERRIKSAPHFRPATKRTDIALLRGRNGPMWDDGMIDGKVCGAAMRIKHDGKGHAPYYTCRRHEIQPAVSPGVSIKVADLDLAAWSDVLHKLRQPELLESLAAEQAALDTSENPASRLHLLKRTRDDFKARRKNLWDSLEVTSDPTVRAELMARIEQPGKEVEAARPT